MNISVQNCTFRTEPGMCFLEVGIDMGFQTSGYKQVNTFLSFVFPLVMMFSAHRLEL